MGDPPDGELGRAEHAQSQDILLSQVNAEI